MKRIILTLMLIISCLFTTSCVSMEEVAYQDEYVIGSKVYPVYWINSYPYYWFDNTWILIPRIRYAYIRTINVPRHVHAYRPNPRHYDYRPHRHDYRRPHNLDVRPSVPHTPQQGRNPGYSRPNTRSNGGSSSHGNFGRGGRR